MQLRPRSFTSGAVFLAAPPNSAAAPGEPSPMPTDPPPIGPLHLSDAQFRDRAADVLALITDYWSRLQAHDPALPVMARTRPGEVFNQLPAAAPETTEPWEAVLDDLDRLILPNLTHWQHPSFFAFFSANASAPAVLGEMLSAGLGVQGMLWATSPACTELETRVLDWLADAFGLPPHFRSGAALGPHLGGGVIQSTASEGTLAALLAARFRARRLAAHTDPDTLTPISVITSTAAHSSVVKAAMIAGVAAGPDDRRHVLRINTDADGRMDLDHLESTLTRVLTSASGSPPPALVTGTLGTTATGAFDDLAGIRAVMDRTWLAHRGTAWPGWLHADAAWAGSAFICPEYRQSAAALAAADSISINPHKWLLTNFDCSLMWTRSRQDLVGSMSITPDYLRNAASDSGSVIDYRDWHVPLGRRFRSLKLWFVLRHYGLEGLRAHIRVHIHAAQELEHAIRADDRFEIPVPRSLSLLCFRLRGPGNELTRRLLDRLNASGQIALTPTTLPTTPDRPAPVTVIRFAIGGTFTKAEHVQQAWHLIQRTAGEVADA